MTALLLLLVSALCVVVPGALVAVAAGARWRDAVAASPSLTLAVVAAGTAVTTAAGLDWGPATAIVAGIVALASAALVGMVVTRSGRRDGTRLGGVRRRHADRQADDDSPRVRSTRPGFADLVVVVLAAVPVLQVVIATRGLTAIPQLWDGIFHGAATRFIADTGRAGLTDLYPVSQPANPEFFYPGTYHALASLLLSVPGGELPAVLNALSAVTGAVFVLGAALLAGRLCRSRLAAVAAAAAAVCTWTFPYAVIDWGPLLPFALGVAVIPGLLVLGEHLATRRLRAVPYALLLGAGMAGAWAAHPSVALAAAVPLATQAVAGIVAARDVRGRASVVGAFGLAAIPAAAYVLWTVTIINAGTTEALAGFTWPRERSVAEALGGVFDLAPTAVASIALATLVLAGVAAAVVIPGWRRPLTAPVVALVGFGLLYVLATAVDGDWVRLLTSYWWDDAHRFAALLAVPSVVLAGAGVRAVVPRGSLRRPGPRSAVAVVAVLGLLASSGQSVVVRDLRAHGYADGPAVAADERVVLDALGERHEGGLVMNDPFEGTAWVYALHGVPVLFPAPLSARPEGQYGPDRMHVYTSINRYGFDPAVTHVVRDLDVRWVIVGTDAVGGPGRPGGFIGLRHNPYLRLVEESPGARLYQVVPVAPDHPPLLPPPGIPPVTPAEQPPRSDSPLVDSPPVDTAPVDTAANLDGAAGP